MASKKNQFILLIGILKIVHKSVFVSVYSVVLCVHCNKIIFQQLGGKMKGPSSTLSPWDCWFDEYLLENKSSLAKRTGPVRHTVLFILYIQVVSVWQ